MNNLTKNKLYQLIIIFTFLTLSTSCNDKPEIISPKKENIVEAVYASGIVKSENQYEVSTRTVGIIKNFFVKEGQILKKGDPICEIENMNSRIGLENAKLNYQANDFEKNIEKLKEAKESVNLAKQRLSNDSLQYERQKILWSKEVGSKIELEQKELNFETSKVNLKKAQVEFKELEKQLKLSSEQSVNNLRIAEETAKDLIVRSDVDGVVYKINMKVGELTSPSTPLAIVGKENFLIELNVDEKDIVKIQVGQKVLISMDSYKNQVFEAEITFIYPIMDERTRFFKVHATFKKAPKVLYPNLSLEANIIISERKNALTIPIQYLINDSTVILESGEKRMVSLGLKDNNIVEVKKGINSKSRLKLPQNER